MRLLIVSHVMHYHGSAGYSAYTPYAREIEIWANLFPEVVIAAPCSEQAPPGDTCLIARQNVRVIPQKEVGGTSLSAKLGIVLALPNLIWNLCREMWKADAIHVRCPGNLGLLGAVFAPLFSKRLIAKYAGQWTGFPGEEWTVRLQRAVLRSPWWRGPVTVYGKPEGQPERVINFFSSMFTAEQLAQAQQSAQNKIWRTPMTVAFAGRLSPSKNVDILLEAIAAASQQGVELRATIMGDGPEREKLHGLAQKLGITKSVEFTGAVSPERVAHELAQAEVFVLTSNTEGWPKAIAEAMAFGLICVGSDLGLIRTFLAEGRGFTVPPRDAGALCDRLIQIANSGPGERQAMSEKAATWAQGYSLDSLQTALAGVMRQWWRLPAPPTPPQAPVQEAQ